MSKSHILIVGGLTTEQHDALKKVSGNRLAPNGHVVVKPTLNGLSDAHADQLLKEAHNVARSLSENTPLSVTAIVIGRQSQQTRAFIQRFFPFALTYQVEPPAQGGNANARRAALNVLVSQIADVAAELRKRAGTISHHTTVGKIGPLLLPVRNFRLELLLQMLQQLFERLPVEDDVNALVNTCIEEFDKKCPRVKPRGEEKKRCYSDGHLFFHGPGRHRHGFFRHPKTNTHLAVCLLAGC